ncbi:MAG: thioredoxin family protein [Deltaproteobacteria bacterium]|nr:thioredoxin family protein [Deltaproteobacteria bacterium]
MLRAVATILLPLLLALPGYSPADVVEAPNLRLELAAGVDTVQPGSSFDVALKLTPGEGWHVYWKNPGDVGLPTTLDWQLPEGLQGGELEFPAPTRFVDGSFVSYGYDAPVLLLSTLTASGKLEPGGQLRAEARAAWTVCREDRCIPGKADLSLELPVMAMQAISNEAWSEQIDAARRSFPSTGEKDWSATAEVYDDFVQVSLRPPESLGTSLSELQVYPLARGLVDDDVPARSRPGGAGLLVSLARQTDSEVPESTRLLFKWPSVDKQQPRNGQTAYDAVELDVELKTVSGRLSSLLAPPVAAAASQGGPDTGLNEAPPVSDMTIMLAFLLALAGGLMLNLMPCVFPVLSLKILSFVAMAGDEPAAVRRHGLVFGAGVVLSFQALAAVMIMLKAGGQELGWGFQLQSPAFVAAMALLLFALALQLVGTFDIGYSLTASAGQLEGGTSGYKGSFLSGVLATVLATPCTAPFMGAALGFAVQRPPLEAMSVFTALGLGMASPYVLLSFSPALLRFLPRPGAWMETFKEAMAFPLFLAAAWLVWVFAGQVGNGGLIYLLAAFVLGGAAAWLRGHGQSRPRALAALGVAVLALLLALQGAAQPFSVSAGAGSLVGGEYAEGAIQWRAWRQEEVDRLRAEGKPVFIDFTADWCLSCKANEVIAFSSQRVVERFRELGVVAMKADWTRGDPLITRALGRYGRDGVPLYVLYDGRRDSEPQLLPQLLTPDIVLEALARIAA